MTTTASAHADADRPFAADVTVVGLDGDDTLWHCEDAFAEAQTRLAELLARHAPTEQVAARLHDTELRNLELFGYGVKGFTLSMVETAIEISRGAVPASDIARILEWGRAMLTRPVELLPGVTEAIERLATRFSLVLVTKGDLWNQESKLARSGLADRFDAVHIVGEKDRGTYARILREHGVPPEQFLMAGNSERSDILPVLELGGYGVHVPYSVTWAHELLPESAERAHPRRRDLPTLAELPDLLGLLSVTAGAEPPPAPCRPLRSDS